MGMKDILFKTPFFRLVKNSHYFQIEYDSPNAGVVIIPVVIKDGVEHLVFVKNFRVPINQDSWELPRGFIDQGEEPIQAAQRELKEETSFRSQPTQLTRIGQVAPDSGLINNKLPVFVAKLNLDDESKEELDSEISEYTLVERHLLFDWLKVNNVDDGISLSALMLYMMNS